MIRRLITIILIMTVLVPAVPYRHACDANRDSRVDLGDVIANMRNLARTAVDPKDFRGELGKAIASIRNVAGLERIVNADDGSSGASAGGKLLYLLPFTDVTPVMSLAHATGDRTVPWRSIERVAVHGPPRCRA
jgi:hypothetical protein